ncbi:uncharacterized protein EV154DRAFT_517740 [Mucor mucedo]|uniref:SUZ domain-containing protein n=1 Tax=Mucor saturninus TaxID=64648 RepID=A0A8H7QUL5_9FUNG|nr:uncharacterized protein EV154DRAFT_517740 [Mucor mucedo]KAG2198073.1 hypothetical protein INT47_011908 [Mucor saturninus]KAI7888393.1 hypothetical protein EV154DRAFT_517740 [Mucor mucedo]
MSNDPWDDWETAADAGLIDCKKAKPTTASANQLLWEKANAYATPVIIQSTTHTEYKPELKILKRPQDAKTRNDVVVEKPIKALADREKEYMEARRKIFEKFENKK